MHHVGCQTWMVTDKRDTDNGLHPMLSHAKKEYVLLFRIFDKIVLESRAHALNGHSAVSGFYAFHMKAFAAAPKAALDQQAGVCSVRLPTQPTNMTVQKHRFPHESCTTCTCTLLSKRLSSTYTMMQGNRCTCQASTLDIRAKPPLLQDKAILTHLSCRHCAQEPWFPTGAAQPGWKVFRHPP